MRSATSSEGPRLVRIAVPCAQTRVATEMHSRTKRRSFEKPAQQAATKPRSKRETKFVFVDVRAERERRHLSGEFEQLLHC